MDIRIIDSHLKPEYLEKYSNGNIFIETGTYLGDTVYLALEFGFTEIHSIELHPELYSRAVDLFSGAKSVHIHKGDSIDCLINIIANRKKDEPATYWLDAHASGPLPGGKSGGSPVLDELNLILKSGFKEDTIFIDDRRLFGSAEWSGVKEEDALALIKQINPDYKIIYLDGHIPEDVLCATVKG